MKIAIFGTCCAGLSNSILLTQHNKEVCLETVPENLALLSRKELPIEDAEIEYFLNS